MDFTYLEKHLDDLVAYMREQQYAKTYINRYRTTVSQISANAVAHSWSSYNDVFLWYKSLDYKESYLRELKAILGKLENFHLYGIYPDAKASKSSFWENKGSYHWLCPEFKRLVDYYCQAERMRGLKETTIYSGSHKSASFLFALQCKGQATLHEVTEESVLSCFFSDGKAIRGASCSRIISVFFRVCMPLNLTECQRIVRCIPALRAARKNVCYLTEDESAKIRTALHDHSNGLSYKDRAIGLLLLHTGMRGGDIANLLLTSIDWGNDKVRFIQQKTQRPLELPLMAVVGNAIYDYCVFERPNVDNSYLFLGCLAPHRSLTTDGIGIAVSRIMVKAEIRQHPGARKGAHIFRHRVATLLLENGISQPVISSTLGHAAAFSLESYLYADMLHLKECALNVELFGIAEEVFAHV